MDIILELVKDFLNEHIEEMTLQRTGKDELNLNLKCVNAVHHTPKYFDIKITYKNGWKLEENLDLQFLLAFLFIGKDDIELLTDIITERKEFKQFMHKGE